MFNRNFDWSWRPYKLVLARLREVNGLERRYIHTKNTALVIIFMPFSLSWLKERLKLLSLSRRTELRAGIARNCIRVSIYMLSRILILYHEFAERDEVINQTSRIQDNVEAAKG